MIEVRLNLRLVGGGLMATIALPHYATEERIRVIKDNLPHLALVYRILTEERP